MSQIDELAELVAGRLARRGFVHDDPRAYRAGVQDAMAALREALAEVERDQAVAETRPSAVERERAGSAAIA